MNNQRTSYLLDSALRYFSDRRCPYCNSRSNVVIDRKYVVSRLLECQDCHLYFRHPKDKVGFNADFYQDTYEEFDLTTNIPGPGKLEEYKRNNFRGSGKDYADRIEYMKAMLSRRPIRIVDYGTSWGYASYQFRQAGFEVQPYEISRPMAEKGNALLGLDIKYKVEELKPGNDIFFSSHVIEHMPDIKFLTSTASRLLTAEGLFIAYSPNGSKAYRQEHPQFFSSLWGMVHPNFLNVDFYSTIFKDHPYLITSSPYGDSRLFSSWDQASQIVDKTNGEELLVVCAINKPI
jgi:hypothetical protein